LLSYFCRQATAEKPTAIFEKILKFKLKILWDQGIRHLFSSKAKQHSVSTQDATTGFTKP
jgi:hypothetical protein